MNRRAGADHPRASPTTKLPDLLAAAAKAGARTAGYHGAPSPRRSSRPLFVEWLERHAPGHKDKVLSRIRSMRGGKLYDAKWGARMKGEGFFAEQIEALFDLGYRKAGFRDDMPNMHVLPFVPRPDRPGSHAVVELPAARAQADAREDAPSS